MAWRSRVAHQWTAMVATLVIGAAMFVIVPFATRAGADTIVPAPPCPTGWTCQSMPSNGGEVQIGPTQKVAPVGSTQPWVFIRGYGFKPGVRVRVHYCDLTAGLTPSPQCVDGTNTIFTSPSTTTLTAFADGTFNESTQVPLNDPAGGTPFASSVPGTSTRGSFYCDGASKVCGLVVTESILTHPSTPRPEPENSTAFPITFDLSPAACPGKQTLLTSESEYGIGPLLPVVDRMNCQASGTANNFFNTEQSGDAAVHDLYNNVRNTNSSAIRVAFTPDPWAPNQQKYLPAGHFVAIPVALTANSIAFQATIYDGNGQYPTTQLNLTPNMVAGIMTGHYSSTAQFNSVKCVGTCPQPPCFFADTCSLMQLASNLPGFTLAQQTAAFPLSYPSGITNQLTSWICDAPVTKVPAGNNHYIEDLSAAQEFMLGLKIGGHPVTSCPKTNMWPAENISGGGWWTSGVSPLDQTVALYKAVPNPGSGAANPVSGFAPMPLAWADYLGYYNANLLNASGAFAGPTAASVDAALADSTYNPDGTLNYSYTKTTDANAYPMPMVIYAVVSTDTMPAGQKAAIQGALTSLLSVTGGSATAKLPAGYFPLTADLYKQATGEVAAAVGNPKFKITDVLPQLASASNTPPSNVGSPFGTSFGNSFGSFSTSTPFSRLLQSIAKTATGSTRVAPVGSSSPLYGTLLLTSSSSRMLVPSVIGIGLLAMLIGTVVLLWGNVTALARRVRPPTPEITPDEVTGGD